jgi:hypothetical protein
MCTCIMSNISEHLCTKCCIVFIPDYNHIEKEEEQLYMNDQKAVSPVKRQGRVRQLDLWRLRALAHPLRIAE